MSKGFSLLVILSVVSNYYEFACVVYFTNELRVRIVTIFQSCKKTKEAK